MLSHIHIGTADLDQAVMFYSDVLGILGPRLKFKDTDRGWAGWIGDADRPLFLVGRPENAKCHHSGNGQMIAFLAKSRSEVDLSYETALRSGAADEGRPGLRPEYHAHYYGAYFRNLDGNKICVCCHEPET